jgi:predicted nucleotidyltransferase
MIIDLEDLLGFKVDIATSDSLHWFVKDQILQEAEPL